MNRLNSWINDLKVSWKVIVGSFFIAFALGVLYMMLVRYTAGLLVWIFILLYFICLAVLGGLCY